MIDLLDPKSSDKIRTALMDIERQGKMNVLAAICGIAGGVKELRKIMNSVGEIPIMDRGMLVIYLE